MTIIQLNALRLNAVDANIIALDGVRRRGAHAGAPPVVPDVPDIPEEPDVPTNPDVDENGYIIFADPEVARICAKNWGDGTGVTLEQAAAVTDIGSVFTDNDTIVSFKELRYFTSVNTLKWGAFKNTTSLAEVDLRNVVDISSYSNNGAFFSAGLRVLDAPALETLSVRSGYSGGSHFYESSIEKILSLGNLSEIPPAFSSLAVFRGCAALRVAIMPNTLTSIGKEAFRECAALEAFVCKASVPPALSDNVFLRDDACIFYIPDESVAAYREASGWSSYASRIFPVSQLPSDNPDLYNEIKDYL